MTAIANEIGDLSLGPDKTPAQVPDETWVTAGETAQPDAPEQSREEAQ